MNVASGRVVTIFSVRDILSRLRRAAFLIGVWVYRTLADFGEFSRSRLLLVQSLFEKSGNVGASQLAGNGGERTINGHFVVLDLASADNKNGVAQRRSVFGGADHVICGLGDFIDDVVVLGLGFNSDDGEDPIQADDVVAGFVEVLLKRASQLRRGGSLDHAGDAFFYQLLFGVVRITQSSFEKFIERFDFHEDDLLLEILVGRIDER
jgi:hypothetical protein